MKLPESDKGCRNPNSLFQARRFPSKLKIPRTSSHQKCNVSQQHFNNYGGGFFYERRAIALVHVMGIITER